MQAFDFVGSCTNLQNLRKRLDNLGVLVAVDLNRVDKRDLCLATFAERFQDGCEFLGAL